VCCYVKKDLPKTFLCLIYLKSKSMREATPFAGKGTDQKLHFLSRNTYLSNEFFPDALTAKHATCITWRRIALVAAAWPFYILF
jgi:hypothetical protein